MTTTINKALELKFRRIAQQMLPKANYANALVINAGDGLICEYLNYLKIPAITGVESNGLLRQAAQAKLPQVAFYESLAQLDCQTYDLIFVLDKIDFLAHETESHMFETITKQANYIVADLFIYR